MESKYTNGANGKSNGAHSSLTTTPLPASRKVYMEGTQDGVHVPFREISLTPMRGHNGHQPESSSSVLVYDTSGPYTDPADKHRYSSGARASPSAVDSCSAGFRGVVQGILGIWAAAGY